MMFKCPVCGERHRVNDNYDNYDTICLNTANRISPKTFQNITPNNILSREGFNFNRSSTKIDEKRAVTVIVDGKPDYKPTAERIGRLEKDY